MPQHQDTSATLAEAYPFMAEGDLGSDGVFIGQDLYSGDSFVYDPWVLHTHFGQENFQREQDGSFAKLESSFGNLVLYRATAKRAFERFTKGDQSSPRRSDTTPPAPATTLTAHPVTP